MKRCGRCKTDKRLEEFHGQSKSVDGRQAMCKVCAKEVKTEWIKVSRNKIRWNALWSKYRLRQIDYEDMLERQGRLCKLCYSEMDRPFVDHNHETGQVRGLLCTRCNLLVGYVETSLDLVPAVLKYIHAPLV